MNARNTRGVGNTRWAVCYGRSALRAAHWPTPSVLGVQAVGRDQERWQGGGARSSGAYCALLEALPYKWVWVEHGASGVLSCRNAGNLCSLLSAGAPATWPADRC